MSMTLPSGVRKLVLTVHLACSVGWIGAVVAYLALGIAAVTSQDAETVRAAWIAMEVTGWRAIVPLALGALLTGLVLALSTPWGLFRHYWVVISLALTILCVVVLLLHMPSVSVTAALLRQPDVVGGANGAGHTGTAGMGGDLFHPTAGLVILLVVEALNVYKPRGLTPYGWRKQQEERARLAERAAARPHVSASAVAAGGPQGLRGP
jgi:hypothetical protein